MAPAATHPDAALTALTAVQAVAAIRGGQLSAEAYVTALIARAEQVSGLCSMISLNQAGALAAARAVDAARATGGTLPVLAGLPIVVKDNINTSDMPTTGATPALRDLRPAANAPMLQRLIDAGAIVLGKANMHELAFGITSTNLSPFAGIVRNPHDPRRIPGGSSGGTAAAIAAGIAPAGLGTDTGGSVRLPAAFCGLAGLRPSVGNGGAGRRYDGTGVLPISHTRDTIGPMARTMADVALLDAAMTGQPMPTPAPLAGLRLGLPAICYDDVDVQVLAVIEAAQQTLRAAGVVLVDVDLAELPGLTQRASFPIVLHEAHDDIPAYLAATGVQGLSLADIVGRIASPDVKAPMAAVLADAAGPQYHAALHVERPRLQALYADCFARHRLAALLFPTTVAPAPLIDAIHGSSQLMINDGPPVDTFAAIIRNTDPGSTAGLPGVTLPAGLTAEGLPVGLALDGPIGSDQTLLEIGMAMEALFGATTLPALADVLSGLAALA